MINYITHSEITDPRQHTFTITGTLTDYKRKDAKLEIELRYAKFSPRLTKNTTILIVGSNPTQETIFNAALKGKYIMLEEEFILMLKKFSAEKMMCEDSLRLYKESLDVVTKMSKRCEEQSQIAPDPEYDKVIAETLTSIQESIARQEQLIKELELPNMEFAFEICRPDDPEAHDADIRDFVSYINGSIYCLDGKVKFFYWNEDINTSQIYEHPCNLNGDRLEQRDFFNIDKPSLRLIPEERDKEGSPRLDFREAYECFPEEAEVVGSYHPKYDFPLSLYCLGPLFSNSLRYEQKYINVEKRFLALEDDNGKYIPCDLTATPIDQPIQYDINKPSLNILPPAYKPGHPFYSF